MKQKWEKGRCTMTHNDVRQLLALSVSPLSQYMAKTIPSLELILKTNFLSSLLVQKRHFYRGVLILLATGITNREKLYHFAFNVDVEELLLSLILLLSSKV